MVDEVFIGDTIPEPDLPNREWTCRCGRKNDGRDNICQKRTCGLSYWGKQNLKARRQVESLDRKEAREDRKLDKLVKTITKTPFWSVQSFDGVEWNYTYYNMKRVDLIKKFPFLKPIIEQPDFVSIEWMIGITRVKINKS